MAKPKYGQDQIAVGETKMINDRLYTPTQVKNLRRTLCSWASRHGRRFSVKNVAGTVYVTRIE